MTEAAPELRRLEKTLESLDRTLHGGPASKGLAWVVQELVEQVEKLDAAIYGKNGIANQVRDNTKALTALGRFGWIFLTVLAAQVVGFGIWAARMLLGIAAG
jgi:hypothetical protein